MSRLFYRISKYIFLVAFLIVATDTSVWAWNHHLSLYSATGDPMRVPAGLFIDTEKERYYIIDTGNNRLVSFDKDGNYLQDFNANGKLTAPFDLVKDSLGRLCVIEKGKNTLTTIDLKNKEVTPHTLTYNGSTIIPHRLALVDGTILVLDKNKGGVVVLDKDLQVRSYIPCPDNSEGFVDFVTIAGEIWGLDRGSNSVYRYSINGKLLEKVQLDTSPQHPVALAISPDEHLFILDRHARAVYQFSRTGRLDKKFLEQGFTVGKLFYPILLRFDPWGRLCVVDEGNGRVEIYNR